MLKEDLIKKIEFYLNKRYGRSIDGGVKVIENETIETEDLFIFFYNSKKYLLTKNFSYCLAGGSPVFVSKKSGEWFSAGTAYPIEHYIGNFRKGLLKKIEP